MFETEPEMARLQAMLDAHLARANEHLTSIVTPERRLTARHVVIYLQARSMSRSRRSRRSQDPRRRDVGLIAAAQLATRRSRIG